MTGRGPARAWLTAHGGLPWVAAALVTVAAHALSSGKRVSLPLIDGTVRVPMRAGITMVLLVLSAVALHDRVGATQVPSARPLWPLRAAWSGWVIAVVLLAQLLGSQDFRPWGATHLGLAAVFAGSVYGIYWAAAGAALVGLAAVFTFDDSGISATAVGRVLWGDAWWPVVVLIAAAACYSLRGPAPPH